VKTRQPRGAKRRRGASRAADQAGGFQAEIEAVPDGFGDTPPILTPDALERAAVESAERRLSAQYAVARILAKADTLAAAAPEILQAVCETLGWDLGALWRVDDAARCLRCVDVWRTADLVAPRFEEATRARTFEPGIGLPGRAWASGDTAWIPDVVKDPNFPRAPIAREEGLHGAFAFSIVLESQVLGVIEIFSRRVREPDQELLRMMAATGSQIGQFIQRREAEAELSRLLERERAAREEADLLNTRFRRLEAITDVVMAHLGLDDLLRELLDAVRLALHTDTATTLLLTEDGKNLAVRAVSGDEEEVRGQVRVPMGKGIAGTVAARREPVIVDDVQHAGPYSDFLRRKVKSMVAVPLETRGRVIGVMHAATFRYHRFTEEDRHLLRLVAERAAAAIENARLYEAEQAARRAAEQARGDAEGAQLRLAFLAEAGTLLGGSLKLQEALQSLAGLAVGFLSDICLIDLLNEDGSIERVVARHADAEKQELADELRRRFGPDPNGPHPAVEVMKTGQPRFSPEMPEEFLRRISRSQEHFEIIRLLGFESYISVPLLVGSRALGALTLVSTDPARRYGPPDVALAEDLARRAALAVDNARLYESAEEARRVAQRAAARTLVLQSVTAALSEAVSSSDVANVVVERGLPVVGGTAGAVVLLEPDGRTLRMVRAHGYGDDVLEPWRTFTIDEPVPIAEAVRTGEPILLRSFEEWRRRYPDGPGPATDGAGGWAALPMMVEGAPVGAIGITFGEVIDLEEDETAFLLALARQCGQALERTRLYDSEQKARREAEAARSRLLFLAEAGQVFSGSLDSDIVLDSITKLVVPNLADWCIVDLLEDDGTVRQTAVSHVVPSMEAVVRELRHRYPPDPDAPHAVWKVLMRGQSELAEEITEEDLRGRATDQMHLKLLTQVGIRSHMVVPLKARGRTLGAVSFVSANRRYGRDDLALAEALVARASLAVDNARLYDQQRGVARALQESLLPPTPPEIPGIDLAARYRAAGEGTEVGGDFYDVFETKSGSWAVVIGDVCGKGAEAAAVTGLARNTIRATAVHEDRPSIVLDQLNRAILEQVADGRFCTVCYARIRPNGQGARVTVCSGGHPLPLVLRVDGTLETAGKPGRLLGVFPETHVSDQVLELAPGDSLILYTDGVTEEVRESVHLGAERLAAAVQAVAGRDANGIADGIEQAVFGSRTGEARDDVAIVVVRIPPRDVPS
jgi:GAF domain-containing protein